MRQATITRRWSAHALAATVAAMALGLGLPGMAGAQDFPARQPVRLVVTFAAGGGADTIARSVNGKLGEALSQTVLVDNRPGAGGIIATDLVAKSHPDGYTVLFTVSSHSINQALYEKLPFDTEKDLRAVTLIGALPQVIAVHPSVPAKNLQEWFALGRKEPKWFSYASGGIGSPGHFAGGLLASMAQVPLHHIPYKGAGPAVADVIGNQVPVVIGSLSSAVAHIKAGRLKALAITSTERSPLLPDVPTIAESGVKDYASDTWIGTFVPRATPDAVVQRLHEATLSALKDPGVMARVDSQAGRLIGGSPAELDALVKSEIQQFKHIVKEQNIKPQ